MNAKQAKRLRKAAIGLAVTLDEAGKKISARDQETKDSTLQNKQDSVRGMYRKFKKAVTRGTEL